MSSGIQARTGYTVTCQFSSAADPGAVVCAPAGWLRTAKHTAKKKIRRNRIIDLRHRLYSDIRSPAAAAVNSEATSSYGDDGRFAIFWLVWKAVWRLRGRRAVPR